jgi:hypothetical protein
VLSSFEFSGVQQHHAAADRREGVLELEIVEDGARRDDVFEKSPQGGDVPLAVAQLVDEMAFSLNRRNMKGLIERAVGGLDPQRCVQDQQRLAYGVDDVLSIVFNVFKQSSSIHGGSPSALQEREPMSFSLKDVEFKMGEKGAVIINETRRFSRSAILKDD